MFLRDGKIHFSADSLDPADPLFSKPGEVLNAPPKKLLEVFSTGNAIVVGPYTDEMGSYISGYAAIQDPVSKKTLAVLGLDMEQNRWARKVAESRQRTIEVTLLLAMFLLGFFVSRRRLLDTAAHLASNERRMVEAQRIAHVGSWDWITGKDRLFWSEETSRIFGSSTSITISKINNFYNLVHPDDRSQVRALFQQVIKSPAPFSFEHRILLSDGTERYVLERGHTLFDAGGKPVRVMGSTQDITERKTMENAQQASEARFRALIEKAPPPIIIIRKMMILYCNPSFQHMFGYEKAEDICNHSLGEVFAPECREMICNRSLRREQGFSEPNDYETTALRRNGTPFFVQIAVTRIELPDGPAGVAFFQDITARKKVELELQRYQESLEARVRERTKELTQANQALRDEVIERWRAEELLRRSEERMRLFFERQLVGMAITSPKREWLQVNDKLCDMLGYSQQELLHLTWSGLTHPDDVEQNLQVFNALAEGKSEGFTLEKRFIRKDGSVLYANMAVGCVRNPDRTLDYVLLLIEDITARKLAETELKKLLAELGRSNKELEQFAYVASHDLQEPLRLVSAYTQLLMQRYRDKLDQNAEPIVKFITEGVSRMQQLILDLLAYSRVSSRSKPFCVENAEKILEIVERNLAISIRETKAVITHDPLPELLCEPTQFGQLLQNLIGNAIKFRGNDPPRIHIGVSKDPTNIEFHFTVSDNGIGIEPEFHERIFIIFQRLHSRIKYAGTGIGLAICKRVVERHNGRIWVESEPGKGATFHFIIPINLKQHDTNIPDTYS